MYVCRENNTKKKNIDQVKKILSNFNACLKQNDENILEVVVMKINKK